MAIPDSAVRAAFSQQYLGFLLCISFAFDDSCQLC